MTYANSKRRDLIERATFFCLGKLPVRSVTRPPFPLLAKIRGLARETKSSSSLIHTQGVVTAIPAVLTPATGIKIRSALFSDLDRLIVTERDLDR